jgi:hypothetical protein
MNAAFELPPAEVGDRRNVNVEVGSAQAVAISEKCSKRRCGRLEESDSVNDRHTNPLARGEHVGGPLLFGASGGIEVRAPR